MADTYDDHTAVAACLLEVVCDDAGYVRVVDQDPHVVAAYLAAAQVQATLALAAAVRELVVTTALPVEALDAIRQKITDPADRARTGYGRRKKSGRPPAEAPAEDLTTPTQ